MKKNIRILYLKDKESKNSKLISFLRREYKTHVYNCVLPNVYESILGHLELDPSPKLNCDFGWSRINILNSIEDTTYEFGIDSFETGDPYYRDYSFRLCFVNYLRSLNFIFKNKTKIKNIISTINNSKIFIPENKLKNYDLIIIENLATAVFDEIYPKETLDFLEEHNKEISFPKYLKYKITPCLLNKLLNSNTKIIHLMDYDKSSLNWLSYHSNEYNNMLERIGACTFSMGKHLYNDQTNIFNKILVGIDFENRIKDSLSEFQININEIYINEISKYFLSFYSDVKKIFINFPIQLSNDRRIAIQDENKIILRGNKNTTKLYPDWDNSLFEKFTNIFREHMVDLRHLINSYNKLEEKTLLNYSNIEKSDLEEYTFLKYLTDDKNKIEEEILRKYSYLINNDYGKYMLRSYLTFKKEYIRIKDLKYLTNNIKFDKKILSEYFSDKKKIYVKDELLNCTNLEEIRNIKALKSFSGFEGELKFLDNQIDNKLIFGIADVSKSKSIVTLSGNTCNNKYFDDNTTSNKNFIKNILEYLIELIKNNPVTDIEFLPQIKINDISGELFINNKKIDLKKTRFCYYRFFAERAKGNEEFITVLQTNDFENYNYTIDANNEKYKIEGNLSPFFIEKVIKYYEKSFLNDDSINRLRNMYKGKDKNNIKLIKCTPSYENTFLSHYSRINTIITESLSKTLTENQLNSVTISRQGNNDLAKYGISLPSANIEIIS